METFDDTMKARVAAFQQANGLTPDGLVGKQTWGVIATKAAEEPVAVTTQTLELPEMPLLRELASCGGDEAGVLDFLHRQTGVDIGAILRELDELADSQPEVTA